MFVRTHRLTPLIVGALFVFGCGKAADTDTVSTPPTPTHSYRMEAIIAGPPINCIHLANPYSNYLCPGLDSTRAFLQSNVVAETLVVRLTGGRIIRLPIEPQTDAIFLSASAVETFLLRHYDAVDTAKATALRAVLAGH